MHSFRSNIKQLRQEVLLNIKEQYMMDPNALASNATIKELQQEMLLNIKELYMKEQDTFEGNETIKQLQQQEVLLDIKERYAQYLKLWSKILCVTSISLYVYFLNFEGGILMHSEQHPLERVK